MQPDRGSPVSIVVDGVTLTRGSRVRLAPRDGGDVFDLALQGRIAIVEQIDQDLEDTVHVTVTLQDDPARGLGDTSRPGRRLYFAADEVTVLADDDPAQFSGPRVLVAGIGNIFLGDDGFGVHVATKLAAQSLPAGVDVVDFGIRGMDLAYALGGGYDAAILIDATTRGADPGTLYVIDTAGDELGPPAIEAHAMDPVRVLRTAASLAPLPARVLLVGCEPQIHMTGDEPDVVAELSDPVSDALDEALRTVTTLVDQLRAAPQPAQENRT